MNKLWIFKGMNIYINETSSTHSCSKGVQFWQECLGISFVACYLIFILINLLNQFLFFYLALIEHHEFFGSIINNRKLKQTNLYLSESTIVDMFNNKERCLMFFNISIVYHDLIFFCIQRLLDITCL